MYTTRILIVALWLALSCRPTLAQQGKTPLDKIPSDCNLVVKVTSPTATFERIKEVLDAASPELGEFAALIPASIEQMLSNPGMSGIDSAADVWLAVRFRSGEIPDQACIVTAKDQKELQESLGETFTVLKAGKWTVYSESSELIDLFKALESGTGRGLNKFVDPNCTEILNRGDLAVWVDLQSLRRNNLEEIETWKTDLHSQLETLPQNMTQQGNVDPQQMARMYDQLLQSGENLLEDARAFCGNVIFSAKGGVFCDNYLSFSYSSETVKTLKTLATSEFKGIEKLPQSHSIYVGVSGMTDYFMKWGLSNSAEMLADETKKQAFAQAGEAMSAVGYGEMTMSMDIGAPNEAMMQSVSLLAVDDPGKLREVSQQMLSAMGEVEQNGVSMKSEVKPEEEEYSGHKADVLTMTYEIADASSPQGMMQKQMLDAMYGSEGLKTRMFYFEDLVMQVAGSQDLVKEALDSYMGKPITKKSANPRNTPPDSPSGQSEEEESEQPDSKKLGVPGLKLRKNDDERSSLFMVEDFPKETLVAALGGDDDDDGGGGLRIRLNPKTPSNEEKQPDVPGKESEKSKDPESPTPDSAASPTDAPPERDIDSGPQEIPKRSVTDAIKLSRGRLSPKSNLLFLVDLPTLIAKTLRRFPIVAAFGLPVSKFVAAAEEASFTGISLAAEGNAFRCRITLPPAQLKGIGKIAAILKPMTDRFQNGEGFTPPPPPPQAIRSTPNQGEPTGPAAVDPAEAGSPPPPKPPPAKPQSTSSEDREERRRAKGKGRD